MDDKDDVVEMDDEAEVLARVTRWAADQPLVRAMVLESSRAVDGAALDAFSDYDVLLVVAHVRPFAEDDGWLAGIGAPSCASAMRSRSRDSRRWPAWCCTRTPSKWTTWCGRPRCCAAWSRHSGSPICWTGAIACYSTRTI